ncbi:MAG: Ig-like domain-containing protein, partial [Chitinophagales bacterium]|nr:Ig-like domain-containing protein [Chitinophagales bacterium]
MRAGTVSVTQLIGTTVDVPIHADTSFTGKNVKAYLMQFSYNSAVLTPVGVVTTATISAQMVPTVNTAVAGQITMAGAGTSALTTSGIFIYLRFTVVSYGGTGISFTSSANNYFNEGTPAMTTVSGSVNITQPPAPSISPASAILIIGETQQFTASGGVAPYTYGITNASVASINTTGLLTATAYGTTKVTALGSNGATGTTSGDVDVRICRLSIPTNYSLFQNQMVDVALSTTSVTGRGLNSGEITLTFNTNLLEVDTILLSGTLLAGSNLLYNEAPSGTLDIAFARTAVISGSGVLMNIRFKAKNISSGNTGISFSSAFFNQSLNAATTNGNVNVQALPALSVSPSSATLFAENTQQFTVSGSVTQPVTWTTTDTNVAKISITGLLTAKRSGIINLKVTDAIGATGQSGNITIYDTKVVIPDTQAVVLNAFNLPVFITGFPATQSVQSMQGTINFKIPELQYVQIVTQGTLTNGWTFSESLQGNSITFAGAGTNAFTTSGILFYLRFTLTADLTVGEVAPVTFDKFMLNEGVPFAVLENGSIMGVVCSNANCNDNNACTTDACVGGSCVNTNNCGTTISGSIVSETSSAVRTVQVGLTGTSTSSLTTGTNGLYSFNVSAGGNYTVTPSKNNDVTKTNGVTTLDITLVRRHLLGSVLLASPYKIIAADVNSSNSVTTLDIALIRRLVLGIDTTFTGNKLWAFVPHDYVFPNPTNPFSPLFPKVRNYTNLSASQASQNFIGMKLGDVNNNWNPATPKMSAVGEVQFRMDEYKAQPNDEIIVPVKVKDFNSIAGYQFTMTWNPEVIQLLEVENQSVSAYYGEQSVNAGMLTTSWNDDAGNAVSLNDDAIAFELKFKVIGGLGTSTEINIGSEITASEAYTDALDLLDIAASHGSVKVGEVISSLNTPPSTP